MGKRKPNGIILIYLYAEPSIGICKFFFKGKVKFNFFISSEQTLS